MTTGHHEHVTRIGWPNVEHGHHEITLKHPTRRDLSSKDLAKRTKGHCVADYKERLINGQDVPDEEAESGKLSRRVLFSGVLGDESGSQKARDHDDAPACSVGHTRWQLDVERQPESARNDREKTEDAPLHASRTASD